MEEAVTNTAVVTVVMTTLLVIKKKSGREGGRGRDYQKNFGAVVPL